MKQYHTVARTTLKTTVVLCALTKLFSHTVLFVLLLVKDYMDTYVVITISKS